MLIHPLPSQYLLASGSKHTQVFRTSTLEYLRLTAWMPEGHGNCEFAEGSFDADEWIEENCHGCKYYFDHRTYTSDELHQEDLEGTDSDDNPITEVRVESKCPCHSEGFDSVDFPCAAGHDDPSSSPASRYDDPLPPMAYAVDFHAISGNVLYSFAWMQAVHQGFQLTRPRRSINCFDDDRVCWGNKNSVPQSLPEVVATYIDASSNEDLMSASAFADNIAFTRNDLARIKPSGAVIGPGFDAALLVRAVEHLNAYLLLRGAGFQAVDGVIALGLHRHVHQLSDDDGTQIHGYISQPDALNRCWFFVHAPFEEDGVTHVTSQGLLLDQIPNPHSSCSSTPLSSSEPVALAAS